VDKQKYIIAGGGCSGLSVALQLAQNLNCPTEIVIIDQEKKLDNDRTWCFWSSAPPCPSHLLHHTWKTMSFADQHGVVAQSIAPYAYYMVRSSKWYNYMWTQLEQYEQVSFMEATIHQIDEDEQGPYVRTNQGVIRGNYVLNSVQPATTQESHWPTYQLWQHFTGWWVEAEQDVFDPKDARLMDFRVEQKGESRFMYVLPYSPRKALVEFTVFSKKLLSPEEYDQEIASYLDKYYPQTSFTVAEKESGKIPMSNRKFNRYQHPHVLNIGTVGGAVKPTTGYAFLRIQNEAKQIAQKLQQGRRVTNVLSTSAARFPFYDRLLLHILTHWGEQGAGIFSALFRANPMRRILTFLNEKSTIWQEARIFTRLPYGPFLRALAIQLRYRGMRSLSALLKKWSATPGTPIDADHQIAQQELR